MIKLFTCCWIIAAIAKATTLYAQEPAERPSWPVALREQLVVIHGADWKLRQAVNAQCANHRMSSGLAIDSLLNYDADNRNLISNELNLTSLPQIIAVADNSPAMRAGMAPGDIIISVNGQTVEFSQESEVQPIDAASQVLNLIDKPDSTAVTLVAMREGKALEFHFPLERICGGVTVLEISESRKAYADLSNIGLTTGFVAFLRSHDELAFALAHEIGHTVFADSARNGLSRRQKERRADRFAVFALTCAGYDANRGAKLLARLAQDDWTSIFGSISHGRTSARISAIKEMERDFDCTNPNALSAMN